MLHSYSKKNSTTNNFFHKYKQYIKQTWGTINSILNKSRKTQDIPDSFHGNNDTNITERSEIANSFNTFLHK